MKTETRNKHKHCFRGSKYKQKVDTRDELKRLVDYLRGTNEPRTTTQITSDIGMPRRVVHELLERYPRSITNDPSPTRFTTLRIRLHESMTTPGDNWREALRQKERDKELATWLVRRGACIV
jgi:hypothetical protein